MVGPLYAYPACGAMIALTRPPSSDDNASTSFIHDCICLLSSSPATHMELESTSSRLFLYMSKLLYREGNPTERVGICSLAVTAVGLFCSKKQSKACRSPSESSSTRKHTFVAIPRPAVTGRPLSFRPWHELRTCIVEFSFRLGDMLGVCSRDGKESRAFWFF